MLSEKQVKIITLLLSTVVIEFSIVHNHIFITVREKQLKIHKVFLLYFCMYLCTYPTIEVYINITSYSMWCQPPRTTGSWVGGFVQTNPRTLGFSKLFSAFFWANVGLAKGDSNRSLRIWFLFRCVRAPVPRVGFGLSTMRVRAGPLKYLRNYLYQ